jgi:AAA15 family ATPase/GTPase
MLIRFGVENFKSIRTYQELSFVASSLKEPTKSVDLIDTPKEAVKILPSVLIYGANASGKSNFMNAMQSFFNYVTHSHTFDNNNSRYYFAPFVFDKNKEVTRFFVELIIDKVKYDYGFSYNENGVTSEKLVYYPLGKPRLVFDRIDNEIKLSESLDTKNIHDLRDIVLKNPMMLLLSIAHLHVEMISAVYQALKYHTIEFNNFYGNNIFKTPDINENIINFIKAVDVGITGYTFRDTNVNDSQAYEFRFKHGDVGDALHFQNESNGTKYLFQHLPHIFHVLNIGDSIIYDEIETSLHPSLVDKIFQLFADKSSNPKGAQLIATTHNPLLLNSDYIRRDQVYFAEKNAKGETELYSLKDFSTRAGGDFTKAYLEGHFGGIPNIGDIISAVTHEKN